MRKNSSKYEILKKVASENYLLAWLTIYAKQNIYLDLPLLLSVLRKYNWYRKTVFELEGKFP